MEKGLTKKHERSYLQKKVLAITIEINTIQGRKQNVGCFRIKNK